jgi:DNA repair protein RadD
MILFVLNELGIPATSVHSKMPARERDDNLARFKAGQVKAMVNADILTTGFDFPALDCIILLRPTNSPGLHVQILGRGTRPDYASGFDLDTPEGRLAAIEHSAKRNCLVLDFAGNTRRLGPINDPRIPKKKGEASGDIPIKQCNECGCLCHISARVCTNCGHEFSFQEKLTPKASTLALIVRDEPQVEVFKVDRVTYAPHVKPGFPPSLKVSYFCGIRRFTEWVCLQHHGNPIQHKAHRWWRERIDNVEPPATIDAALPLCVNLRTPTAIRVWINRKYPEILRHEF